MSTQIIIVTNPVCGPCVRFISSAEGVSEKDKLIRGLLTNLKGVKVFWHEIGTGNDAFEYKLNNTRLVNSKAKLPEKEEEYLKHISFFPSMLLVTNKGMFPENPRKDLNGIEVNNPDSLQSIIALVQKHQVPTPPPVRKSPPRKRLSPKRQSPQKVNKERLSTTKNKTNGTKWIPLV